MKKIERKAELSLVVLSMTSALLFVASAFAFYMAGKWPLSVLEVATAVGMVLLGRLQWSNRRRHVETDRQWARVREIERKAMERYR